MPTIARDVLLIVVGAARLIERGAHPIPGSIMDDFPIHDAAAIKPEVYQTVRIWLADGTEATAVWTGFIWWGDGESAEPVRWQELRPVQGDIRDT